MDRENRNRNWQQYFDSSSKKAVAEIDGTKEKDDQRKATEAGLISSAQNFQDILTAIEIIGEIKTDSKTYTTEELKSILEEAKKSKNSTQIPEALGLREAVDCALKGIARQDYRNNLENLFVSLDELVKAKKIEEICPSLEENKTAVATVRKKAVSDELFKFERFKKFYEPDGKGDPDDNDQVPPEVQDIAKRVVEMVGKIKIEAYSKIDTESAQMLKFKSADRVLAQKKSQAVSASDDIFVQKNRAEIKLKKEAEKKSEADKQNIFETKKKELEEIKKEKTAGEIDPEIKKRHTKIAEMIEELDVCRKEYLERDYEKTAALARVRSFFDDKFGKKKEITIEKKTDQVAKEDSEIADFKKRYDDKFRDLSALILEDAKMSNLSDDKLAELLSQFRIEQRITLAEEHDKIKAEKLFGTKEGWVKEKMIGMVDWYQKLPLKYKLGIAVGMVAGGAGISLLGAGASAAATFSAIVVAKRGFGGLVAGVGVRRGLEAEGQRKDQKKISKDQQKNLEELKKIEADEKYDFLSKKMDEIISKDGEDALKRIKNQDIRQNLAGAVAGIFLASGFAGQLIKDGFHGVADYFSGHEANSVLGDKLPEIPKSGAYAGESIEGSKSEIPAVSAVPEVIAPEGLTIEKGSSIEGTIIEYLKEHHPEIKNPGVAAHRVWIDYMDDNKDAIVAKVGQDEYVKMLKDGMVNVKPGTIISIDNSNPDSLNWKITGIGSGDVKNDFSHLDVPEHHATLTHSEANVDVDHNEPVVNEKDVHSASYENSQPGFKIDGEIPVDGNGEQPAGFKVSGDEIYINDGEQSSDLDLSQAGNDGAMMNEYSPANSFIAENMSFLSNSDHGQSLRSLREVLFDKDPSKFRALKDANVVDALNKRNGTSLDGLSRKAQKLIAALSESKEFRPQAGDNFEGYTRKIVALVDKYKGEKIV
ncbi:MAG: hypothetical protein HGA61_03130 [Candidatus Moranbacteria bacterium]|nr:hypothetical protein [Candidatus Moranbacteria bacterium]